MQDVLTKLEEQWKEVSQYDDIRAIRWTPGEPVLAAGPEGCELKDTGWLTMSEDEFGVEAFRRTVFCRDHGFARIYVISGSDAAGHGWSPPGD